ncbi:MAG: hypothetical protein KJ638_10840 [Chloroflexi bacterium]|nr:hypothetical protein [Chloroflexota bacterium]
MNKISLKKSVVFFFFFLILLNGTTNARTTSKRYSIDHIFITFHAPAFRRFRHTEYSPDEDPELRNAFWRMLIRYKDKVRAVFVGHAHVYYRMRVLDPAGISANDANAFPDEAGGIYQVNAGAAGVASTNTIVQVQIEDRNVFFNVFQANAGPSEPFSEVDKWEIVQHP